MLRIFYHTRVGVADKMEQKITKQRSLYTSCDGVRILQRHEVGMLLIKWSCKKGLLADNIIRPVNGERNRILVWNIQSYMAGSLLKIHVTE